MSINTFECVLELDQGVGHGGRIYGYDHENRNFVTWRLNGETIEIHKIEHDEMETACGPIEETRKRAERFLSRPYLISYRALRRSIRALQEV